jgi:integrative and conjugative element protein (TIGR02256 family)
VTAWLDSLALTVIESEARHRRFCETGGPLFGYEGDGDEIVIAVALGPGPSARHRPRSFRPDRNATGQAIAAVHERTSGRYRYIGSWHTHPLGRANPSGVDLATARDIASQEEVDLPRPLIVIQATRPSARGVRMGELQAYRWEPVACAMVSVPRCVTELDDRFVDSTTAPMP